MILHARRGVLRLGLAAAVGLALPVAVSAVSRDAAAIRDRDCADVKTQKKAQRFFIKQGGPRQDPHRLDADRDGIACESNP